MTLTRRSFLKCAGIGAMSLSFGGVLSACSSGSAPKASASVTGNADEVVVSMTTSSEPAAGFDPLVSMGLRRACARAAYPVDAYHHRQADLGFVNDLATAYSCSEDGLTWTFTIRDDAKFTDGQAAYRTRRGLHHQRRQRTTLPAEARPVHGEEGRRRDDDTVAELHLNKPFNALLYTLAGGGHRARCMAYDSASYGANPIGSAAATCWSNGIDGQQVILKANPDYYGEAPADEARRGGVHGRGRLPCGGCDPARLTSPTRRPPSADASSPCGYDLLDCTDGG